MNTRRENGTIAVLAALLFLWFVVPWVLRLIVFAFGWLRQFF